MVCTFFRCFQNVFVLKNLKAPDHFSKVFVFFLNTKIGNSAKVYYSFGSICKTCQFLLITFLKSSTAPLWVAVIGTLSALDVLTLFSILFLGIVIG